MENVANMNKQAPKRKLSKEMAVDFFILFLILLSGLLIRLLYLTKTQFPLNDGGLFYQMTNELIANHFRLPRFTLYNHLNIPFAYPPFSFYLAGILKELFSLDLLQIFRFLPLVFNLASIPVFYFLTKEFLQSRVQVLIAAGTFALLTPVFEWLIMGGGVARSPAFFFSLLSLLYFLKYTRQKNKWFLITSALFAALTFCTHLEMLWFLVISIGILIPFENNKLNLRRCLDILVWGLMLIFLSSPYWVTILLRFGFSPFISAFQTGEFNFGTTILSLVMFDFTREQFLQLFQVFAVLGFLLSLKDKNFKIPLWAFILILLDPRSICRSISLPFAMLAGISLEKIIYTPFSKIDIPLIKIKQKQMLLKNAGLLILLAFFTYTLLTHFLSQYTDRPVTTVISQYELESYEWVRQNCPQESSILILPSGGSWQSDAVMEWFPVLTGRHSLITVQGTEWLKDDFFKEQVQIYLNLKEQVLYSHGIYELENPFSEVNYIYCSNTLNRLINCQDELILNNQVYSPIYANEHVVIYEK